MEDAQRKFIVYAHENKLNGKVYIGITSQENPENRWQHGKGYKGTYFYNAINKYGWDNFDHKILFNGLSKKDACNMEIKLIKDLQANNRQYGYNIADGGQLPGKCALEALKLCNEAARVPVVRLNDGTVYSSIIEAEKNNNVPNTNIVKVCKGERHTAGKMANGDKIYWAYYSDDMDVAKEFQIRKNTKRTSNYKNSIKVVCVTTNEIFLSIQDAERKYGSSGAYVEDIIKSCKGKYDYSGKLDNGKPLRWMYYWDYIVLNEYELDEIRKRPVNKYNGRLVKCIEDNIMFNSIVKAAKFYNIENPVRICQQLNGRAKDIYINNKQRKIHFVEVDGGEFYDCIQTNSRCSI